MPKILELKQIDGQMWARLDIDFNATPPPVSLLIQPEVDRIRRAAIINELEDLAENFEGSDDIGSVWRGQEIADAIRERIKNHPRS